MRKWNAFITFYLLWLPENKLGEAVKGTFSFYPDSRLWCLVLTLVRDSQHLCTVLYHYMVRQTYLNTKFKKICLSFELLVLSIFYNVYF
jgi:hypothetical protein